MDFVYQQTVSEKKLLNEILKEEKELDQKIDLLEKEIQTLKKENQTRKRKRDQYEDTLCQKILEKNQNQFSLLPKDQWKFTDIKENNFVEYDDDVPSELTPFVETVTLSVGPYYIRGVADCINGRKCSKEVKDITEEKYRGPKEYTVLGGKTITFDFIIEHLIQYEVLSDPNDVPFSRWTIDGDRDWDSNFTLEIFDYFVELKLVIFQWDETITTHKLID